ncbi:MAG: hypothetical protein WB762_30300 [Candidatus Sulfotelmatobacter sp.]
MKRLLAVALFVALMGSLYAAVAQQDQSSAAAQAKKKKVPSVAEQLAELRGAIEAQQKQILDLGQQLQSRDQRIQQLEQRLDQSQAAATQAQAKADTAVAQTADQQQTVVALKSDVADLKTSDANVASSLQETQKTAREQAESPLAIRFKGITLTPGGFLAGESVYRNRALASDINTPFNSVNMPGAGQNEVSEFFGSGRQSRISMLAEGKVADFRMSGYYEADFLSAGVTSNNNESNSYTLRQRQVWGQVADKQWSLTGGQMWSLVTETKHGMDNRTEAVPMTIDPQYNVGFSWARQYGVRLVKNFNDRFWLGASVENPQTTFAARNNAENFALGSAGNGSGLYNSAITTCSTSTIAGTNGAITTVTTTCTNAANYSFNAMPDFIFKAAAEPGFGHYEVFGILSRFRDRVYPCAEPAASSNCNGAISALGAYNNSVTVGGVGANARVTFFKQLDFGLHAVMGEGMGRYGSGGLPDSTVNADGTLAPLRSYQGLATLEWHTKRLDLYLNGGEEYVARRWQFDPNNPTNPFTPVGYGSPLFNVAGCYSETSPSAATGFAFGSLSKCNADTQYLLEGTAGLWIKVHSGPRGRLQFGPQYSYVSRNAWKGTNGSGFSDPHGIDNMLFTSFRYYLP